MTAGMRRVALAIASAALIVVAAPAHAQSKPVGKADVTKLPTINLDKRAPDKRELDKRNPDTRKACAEYGEGFVQVAGSATCVQVRGYVRMQGSAR